MAFWILLMIAPVLLAVCLVGLVPRIRMERRARALLAKFPDAERTSPYLPFHSAWAGGKGKEMDSKISEMNKDGWTFLRAREARPLNTLFTLGGGVNLEFIRITT